jgi:hypothetical protein
MRVCDEAAETISHLRKDLKFELIGDHQQLDRQIGVIRERLRRVGH